MFKRNLGRIAFGLVLGGMLVLPAISNSQVAPQPNRPAANLPNAPGARALGGEEGLGRRERHPAVRKSIKMLERTKFLLQKDAAHDLGGHRVQAIKDIDEAISQLRLALASDVH